MTFAYRLHKSNETLNPPVPGLKMLKTLSQLCNIKGNVRLEDKKELKSQVAKSNSLDTIFFPSSLEPQQKQDTCQTTTNFPSSCSFLPPTRVKENIQNFFVFDFDKFYVSHFNFLSFWKKEKKDEKC